MADLQNGLQRCAQARQFIKSAKAMKGSKSLVMKALELYRSVLEEFGQELTEPYWGMAYISYAGGRPDIALAFLKSGLQLDGGHARMRQLLPRVIKSNEQREAHLKAQMAKRQAEAEKAKHAENTAADTDSDVPNQLVSDLGLESSAAKVHQGPEVTMLQRALRKLGHSLPLSAEFDRSTYAAVRAVQSLHKLPVTGWVDSATREILNPIVRVVLAEQSAHQQLMDVIKHFTQQLEQEANAFQSQMTIELLDLLLEQIQEYPDEEATPIPLADDPPRPREALTSRLGNMGQMGIVSKGIEVFRVQQVLDKLGYPVKCSGQFDLQTFSEISRFQLDQKLAISGIVEGLTRDRLNVLLQPIFHEEAARESILHVVRAFQRELNLPAFEATESCREELVNVLMEVVKTGKLPEIPETIVRFFKLTENLGPSNRPGHVSQGREVRLLQQVLQQLGFKVDINGSYDNTTYGAVRSFQISKKLAMTGIIEEKTRAEINTLVLDVLSHQSAQS